MTSPLPFIWNSEQGAMFVDRRYLKLARRTYADGDTYPLEYTEYRSLKSLRHYHAAVKDIFDNLPDDMKNRWDKMVDDGVWNISPSTSPDILRKWALIKTGWRRERVIVCETASHAKRWIKNMYDDEDPFSITVVHDKTITIYRARSQSMYGPHKMTAAEFKESKSQVLDLLGSLIGVKRTELEKAQAHK